MTVTATPTPYYATGGTYKFRATVKKDGVAWDLTSATVTVVFTLPDQTEVVKVATVENGPAGIAYYVTLPDPGGDLSVGGYWSLYYRIVDGGLDLTTEPYGFPVHPR